jgi:hypothetical protein
MAPANPSAKADVYGGSVESGEQFVGALLKGCEEPQECSQAYLAGAALDARDLDYGEPRGVR